MGLPVIQELWDGLRWLIDFFVNKLPKPILFLIFLLFLMVFGFLISWVLHLSGIHCNSASEVVKVDLFKLGTNANILWETKDGVLRGQEVTICEAHPKKCGKEHDCYFFALELDNGRWAECNITNSSANCIYLLKEGSCFNCTSKEICFEEAMWWIICGQWHDVCIDDAYAYHEDYSMPFDCNWYTDCGIPKGYMWNSSTGKYNCIDQDICGANATYTNTILDDKLDRAGAKSFYTGEKSSMEKAVYIKCDKNLNPDLTFFGFPIFDYKIWLVIMLIFVLFIFLNKIKRH